MTDRQSFAQFVRQRQQGLGSGKQLAAKIRAQTIGHDRNLQPIGDPGQLPDLVFG